MIRRLLVVALFVTGCAHRAPSDALPIAVATPSRVLKTSSAPWKMPVAPDVSLTTPDERFVFAILDTYPTGLSPAHERAAAKTLVGECRKNGLDPYLVLALIRVESSGSNWAESSVGARGLMQIRPFVGRELARGTDVVWQGPETLNDPVANLVLGTKYLVELRDRFGSMELALAAYNMGPTRLQQKIDRPESAKKIVNDYADKILWFSGEYRAMAVPGNDVQPGIAKVTVATVALEKKIGGRPKTALAIARTAKKKSPVAKRLDLNAASFGELIAFDVPAKSAKAIIEWREKNGRFNTVDELAQVRGLDAKARAKLTPRVQVAVLASL